MPSRISNPSAGSKIIGRFSVGEGGHGKAVARDGLIALGGFPNPDIALPLNPIPLDANGAIAIQYFGDIKIVETGIDGPANLSVGSLGCYFMTTFDTFGDYPLSCEKGKIWREDRIIYFQAPSEPGPCWFQVDTRRFTVSVVGTAFKKPAITSPENNYSASFTATTITCTDAIILNNSGTEDHISTDWELSKDPNFQTKYRAAYHSQDLLSWPLENLTADADFYVRVRHNGYKQVSDWSEPVHFSTSAPKLISAPSILTPTQNQFGVTLPVEIQASGFMSVGFDDTHVSSDWIISTTANFSNIVAISTADEVNKTSFIASGLQPITLYYAKVRYRGTELISHWSPVVSFITFYQ